MTWPDAQKYCRETYDDLATIENELDWIRLKAEEIREGLTDVAWVGLYNDIDSWRWSSNNLPLKNTFHYWNIGGGQPDNNGGHQSCCATGPFGQWWDDTCTDLFPFICYNGELSVVFLEAWFLFAGWFSRLLKKTVPNTPLIQILKDCL